MSAAGGGEAGLQVTSFATAVKTAADASSTKSDRCGGS